MISIKTSKKLKLSYKYQVSSIRYQVSGIKYQVSSIKLQVSSIKYQVSGIKYQVSGIRYQKSKKLESSYLFFQTGLQEVGRRFARLEVEHPLHRDLRRNFFRIFGRLHRDFCQVSQGDVVVDDFENVSDGAVKEILTLKEPSKNC
jgi:hypothetical protein